MSKNKSFLESSCLFGANSTFVEELHDQFLADPESVDESWREFFQGTAENREISQKASWSPKVVSIIGAKSEEEESSSKPKTSVSQESVQQAASDSIRAHMLIRAYRVRGHLSAKLDPLELETMQPESVLQLDPSSYGFTEDDYDREIYIGNEIEGIETITLRNLVSLLRKIYCRNVGAEFMHIQSLEQKEWIQQKIEALQLSQAFGSDKKKKILQDIIEVETFEQFLHVKFPGTKRFSVEGGENSLAAINAIIEASADHKVKEIIIGMPHRGRLNVLTKIMGKPYSSMLSEFQGNLAHPEHMEISGDVKYHLGTSSSREFDDGHSIHVSLTANPSHLEAVNPVVAGRVRAKQNLLGDTERSQVLGVLLHGDAAFAGQGVVAETLSLGDLAGYKTGGTVHIIVNNQIGFTTSPKNARVSRYPTEMAKIVQAPIFHVDGDDPEAVVNVSRIAAEFRHKFKKDVVVDVICYRKYGHNEGDEPLYTQPLMYKKIKEHKSPVIIYAERLIQEGVISDAEFAQMRNDFKGFLEEELKAASSYKKDKAEWLEGKWKGFKKSEGQRGLPKDNTGVAQKDIKRVGAVLSEKPESITLNKKIANQLDLKKKMIDSGKGIDWATAEALAFGTLVDEGVSVRITGQDSCRGTFSHRHAVFTCQETENKYTPLQHISENQATFEVIDSNLSEFAVLGFEYGYSLTDPRSLTLWEGQFGDFANGAQVIIDQFIASGETKWLRMSGLVMLLPHGYEGQGPEHSSARLERFLQLCAEDNIQVVNCTTPANYFHVLRRQVSRTFRKPLIVMSPKSLLRHKLAVSETKELTKGTQFQRIIPEVDAIEADKKIRRVVLCSGKVYYDLYEERQKRDIKDIAIIRVEQYYPFPEIELVNELKRYSNAEVVWCQEEPKNFGAWTFVRPNIENVQEQVKSKHLLRYVGRVEAASSATGYKSVHDKEQAALLDDALTIKK